MKTFKIKTMSKKKKKCWLEAIEKLRQHYLRRKRALSCPLCDVPTPCVKCLWVLFEENTCGIAAAKTYDRWDGRWRAEAFKKDCSKETERWRKDSLRRLNRWEKKLKE